MSKIMLDATHPKLVALHVMHSWGGGLEKWVQDYCRTDTSRNNLVLKSFGSPGTPGERLALFQHIDDPEPIRVWELNCPISATCITNIDYFYALKEIINNFNVDTIIISSFIGHSLDLLNTGIDTIVVCHDYYPFCPAINIYFEKICTQCSLSHLQHCFKENKYNRFFSGILAAEWMLIREHFLFLIQQHKITLVVPSLSVQRNLTQLEPGFKEVNFVLIPHGTNNIEKIEYSPKDNPTNKLKVLILGSLALHKGLELFKNSYKEILDFADIFLLGCGEEAVEFANIEGIHIAAKYYTREELPRLVASIAPDLGLLLSLWPETFAYTLSELMSLGIPTLATKVGSFEDRIQDGVNGFLAAAEKTALIQKIKQLSLNRDLLLEVAKNLREISHRTKGDMVDDYQKLLTCKTDATDGILQQVNLKQMVQAELIRLESQLRQSKLQWQHTESQLHHTQSQLQSHLHHTQEQFLQLQSQLQHTQTESQYYKDRVTAMETSKFWKIRKAWFIARKFMGIKGDE